MVVVSRLLTWSFVELSSQRRMHVKVGESWGLVFLVPTGASNSYFSEGRALSTLSGRTIAPRHRANPFVTPKEHNFPRLCLLYWVLGVQCLNQRVLCCASPPLFSAPPLQVVNRTTIRMEIHADSSGSTILDGHMGPLTIRVRYMNCGAIALCFSWDDGGLAVGWLCTTNSIETSSGLT